MSTCTLGSTKGQTRKFSRTLTKTERLDIRVHWNYLLTLSAQFDIGLRLYVLCCFLQFLAFRRKVIPFARRSCEMAANGDSKAPTGATDAVLKPSDPIAEGEKEVKGLEFDRFQNKDISVRELVEGMGNMGFQATSVGEAVRIINEMVGDYPAQCSS